MKRMRWDKATRRVTEPARPPETKLYASSYIASKSGPVRRLTPQELAKLSYGPPRKPGTSL